MAISDCGRAVTEKGGGGESPSPRQPVHSGGAADAERRRFERGMDEILEASASPTQAEGP